MSASPPTSSQNLHPTDVAARPLIGITADADDERFKLRRPYISMVREAGGVPLILPCAVDMIDAFIACCDGIILSGGDDPDMAAFGESTHPRATPIDPDRQAFELALLARLDAHRDTPTLGICLGMQLMGLHAGGTLNQFLPDTLATAAEHWGRVEHTINGPLGRGTVFSHHRQALTDPGRLTVASHAHDGVIEAIRDDGRPYYVGVQWHPERTADDRLGLGIICDLIDAARTSRTLRARGR